MKKTAIIAFGIIGIFILFGLWNVGKVDQCEVQNKTVPETQQDACDRFSTIGYGSLILGFGFLVYMLFKDRKRQKIPFSIIKSKFIEDLEKKEKITCQKTASTFKLTEENNRYVFILKDVQDDLPVFFMCEADVYTGLWGRGFGQHTKNQMEAEHWYATRSRYDIKDAMQRVLQDNKLKRLAIESGRLTQEEQEFR